jgi:hypothetical protein
MKRLSVALGTTLALSVASNDAHGHGWYLVGPPLSRMPDTDTWSVGSFNEIAAPLMKKFPLSEWSILGAFDMAKECEGEHGSHAAAGQREVSAALGLGSDHPEWPSRLRAGRKQLTYWEIVQCITANDPRLIDRKEVTPRSASDTPKPTPSVIPNRV